MRSMSTVRRQTIFLAPSLASRPLNGSGKTCVWLDGLYANMERLIGVLRLVHLRVQLLPIRQRLLCKMCFIILCFWGGDSILIFRAVFSDKTLPPPFFVTHGGRLKNPKIFQTASPIFHKVHTFPASVLSVLSFSSSMTIYCYSGHE